MGCVRVGGVAKGGQLIARKLDLQVSKKAGTGNKGWQVKKQAKRVKGWVDTSHI
jgi:hypothetical protein